MFKLRLTDDELVTVQREYLRTAESLNVLNHEIARLKALGEGVVAGRRILEQEYEKQKLEASLLAEQQALVVHGISQDQVEEILKKHQLLRDFLVRAPDHFHSGDLCQSEHLFHVQSLPVSQGQQVSTGQDLAVLADHCQLYVEGRAFEDDATGLREAARNGWEITANLLPGNGLASAAAGLKLLYLADRIDPESRAFRFYLQLPNEVVLDQTADDGRRYLEWHYKPGQRMQLAVPVQRWEQQLVLPVTAVVDEGGEVYVYRQNGGQFDRVSVHVVYRDQNSAVVENNGSLFPGDIVAGQGAYQMHLALKNKSAGGVDPHAGHNH
jgi:multidrug efflux pump subunit AcrA (membrane-fusion protein)